MIGDVPEFRILTAPYELGRLRDGTGTGAEALLEAGAAEALASAGARVETETIELDGRYATTGHGDVDAAFALIAAVADRVGAAAAAGAVPVVLGGSCFLGVGVTAGLPAPDPLVLYLDAHADFNHPDTSEHGYFDGMGLAVMTLRRSVRRDPRFPWVESRNSRRTAPQSRSDSDSSGVPPGYWEPVAPQASQMSQSNSSR